MTSSMSSEWFILNTVVKGQQQHLQFLYYLNLCRPTATADDKRQFMHTSGPSGNHKGTATAPWIPTF